MPSRLQVAPSRGGANWGHWSDSAAALDTRRPRPGVQRGGKSGHCRSPDGGQNGSIEIRGSPRSYHIRRTLPPSSSTRCWPISSSLSVVSNASRRTAVRLISGSARTVARRLSAGVAGTGFLPSPPTGRARRIEARRDPPGVAAAAAEAASGAAPGRRPGADDDDPLPPQPASTPR